MPPRPWVRSTNWTESSRCSAASQPSPSVWSGTAPTALGASLTGETVTSTAAFRRQAVAVGGYAVNQSVFRDSLPLDL